MSSKYRIFLDNGEEIYHEAAPCFGRLEHSIIKNNLAVYKAKYVASVTYYPFRHNNIEKKEFNRYIEFLKNYTPWGRYLDKIDGGTILKEGLNIDTTSISGVELLAVFQAVRYGQERPDLIKSINYMFNNVGISPLASFYLAHVLFIADTKRIPELPKLTNGLYFRRSYNVGEHCIFYQEDCCLKGYKYFLDAGIMKAKNEVPYSKNHTYWGVNKIYNSYSHYTKRPPQLERLSNSLFLNTIEDPWDDLSVSYITDTHVKEFYDKNMVPLEK